MGKHNRLDGLKFLAGVLVLYFIVFFFSYFYFMAAGPIIIGNVIAGVSNISTTSELVDAALIKTGYILGVIVLLVVLVFFIPTSIHKRRSKKVQLHKKRYKPFKD